MSPFSDAEKNPIQPFQLNMPTLGIQSYMCELKTLSVAYASKICLPKYYEGGRLRRLLKYSFFTVL